MLRNVLVDTNNLAGSIPVFSGTVVEEGGLDWVTVNGFTYYGVRFDAKVGGVTAGNLSNFSINHVGGCAGAGAGASTVELYVSPPNQTPLGSGGTVDDVTMVCQSGHNCGTGLLFDRIGNGVFTRLHTEQATDGVKVQNSQGGHFIGIVGGPNVTNSLHVASSNGWGPEFEDIACATTNNTTNVVVDDRISNTSPCTTSAYNQSWWDKAATCVPGTVTLNAQTVGTGALASACTVTIPANYLGPGPTGVEIHWAIGQTTGAASVAYQVNWPAATGQQSFSTTSTATIEGATTIWNNPRRRHHDLVWKRLLGDEGRTAVEVRAEFDARVLCSSEMNRAVAKFGLNLMPDVFGRESVEERFQDLRSFIRTGQHTGNCSGRYRLG